MKLVYAYAEGERYLACTGGNGTSHLPQSCHQFTRPRHQPAFLPGWPEPPGGQGGQSCPGGKTPARRSLQGRDTSPSPGAAAGRAEALRWDPHPHHTACAMEASVRGGSAGGTGADFSLKRARVPGQASALARRQQQSPRASHPLRCPGGLTLPPNAAPAAARGAIPAGGPIVPRSLLGGRWPHAPRLPPRHGGSLQQHRGSLGRWLRDSAAGGGCHRNHRGEKAK